MSYGTHGNSQYNIYQAGQQFNPRHDLSTQGIDGIPLRATTAPTNIHYNANIDNHGKTHKQTPPLRSRSQDHSAQGYQQVGSPPRAPYSPKQAGYPTGFQDISQHFSQRGQTLKLFLTEAVKFLVTIIFIAMFVVALRSYQGTWVFRQQGKNWFNAVITGLAIAFGVHLATSMKSLAGKARWYLLAQRFRPIEEANLLLGCDSLSNILQLVWKARNRRFPSALIPNLLPLLGVAWLLINVGLQVGVALIGLTYSVDNSQHVSLGKAPVAVPNLAVFSWRNNTNITDDDQQRYAAHSLGLIGSSMYFGSGQNDSYLGPISDPSNSSARTIDKDDKGWTYRMVDSSTDGKTNVITNRTISSTTICKFYNVSQFGDGGDSDVIIVEDWPGLDEIFVGHASPGASNYLTKFDDDCGARCTRVQVFQAKSEPEKINVAGFFDCNTTISTVEGAYAPAHDLSDKQAKIAAGAVGFGGPSNFSSHTAYQVYPNNAYGANSTQGNPTDMGFFLSSFAIQVVASVGAFIPRVNITTGHADSPAKGFGLSVQWHQSIPIFATIAAVHLALILLIIPFASRVIVHDDSPLGMARLLKSQADRLGAGGSLADGNKMAQHLRVSVAYGFREPQDVPGEDLRSLVVSRDVDLVRPLKFPNGIYA